MREITVKIAADGSTTETSVNGVKGKGCEDLTKSLLNALGTVEDSKKNPEYFLQDIGVVHDTGS